MSDESPYQSYLPRVVRYWDENAPGRLHRQVEGSLVFVDISGFTKMSERLARHGNVGAEEVTDVIDNTFAQLLPEAYMFGANLLKFGGDALLLLFTDDGHAERAVAGAHAMRMKLREVGRFQTTAGKVTLRMSVGVHSGLIDFFLVGSSHRELVIAGPAASRTVEMEGAANAGQVLLSPETAGSLHPGMVGEASGPGLLLRAAMPVTEIPIEPSVSPDIDLSQFIPTALRTALAEEAIEPEHRPTAIAFIHYEGFDRLLAEEGGEATGSVLQELLGAIQEASDERGVTFLATDVAGDGGKVILTAGVPDTTGNDNERLLLVVRDILRNAPSKLPLQIGVNWGPIFAGAVGPFYRRTYTVMGDAVNLAARLMAKAPAGEIYTVREVLDASRTTFHTTKPEPFYVKGKRDPIQAYSVGEPEGSRDATEGADLPLIGRDRQLAAMLDAWSDTAGGKGATVEVAAEVGMGKSRLLTEFTTRSEPPKVVRSECRLYQASTPYFPFRALLADAWELGDGEAESKAKALTDLVESTTPHLLPWLALIGDVLDLEIDESPQVTELDDQFRPARTLAAVEGLLAATVTTPTLFVIEDTHWMDDASIELLGGLVAATPGRPWMFLLTKRPLEQGFSAEGDWVRRLELGPIEPEDARRMILTATADSPLLPHQIDQLVARAGGRPLFLLELLKALRRGSDVEQLPSSVEGLIAARIDELPRADRHLLRRLSVLGNGFQLEYTTSILDDSEQQRRRQFGAMRRLGEFLTTDGKGWIQFRSTLIRDVAYEGLPFKTRAELHARVGKSIRQAAGDNPESQAELLSLHFFQARAWEEAWRFSRIAGEAAKSVYANQTAAIFYRRALTSARQVESTVDERADVAEALGDVLEQAGLYEEALDAYGRALTVIGDDPGRRGDILFKRAQVKMRKGEYALALRDSAIGIRLVDGHTSHSARSAKARLVALRATIRMAQTRPREALELASRAAEEAGAAEEKQALARSLATMDWAHFVLGEPERATNSQQAFEIYESLGLLDKAADVVNNMGGFAYYLGAWDESLSRYQQAREMYLKAGNDWSAAMVGANLGELLVSQRKLEEAEPLLEDAVRILRAANARNDVVFAQLQLARLVAERGDMNRACAMFTRVRDEAEALGQVQFAFEASLYRASCRISGGETTSALDEIRLSAEKAGEEADVLAAKQAQVMSAAYLALGQTESAYAAIEAGIESAQEFGLIYEEALLRMERLRLDENLGRAPDEDEAEVISRLLSQLGLEQAAEAV
ncbi:MAG TPA: adenylate/guanylate cyclase domain-containing protein [Acidimicrobiia bacterium]|nr:adenylate/guanylate cyclase domain-containing protein [Acidimicrobiia bacterium]